MTDLDRIIPRIIRSGGDDEAQMWVDLNLRLAGRYVAPRTDTSNQAHRPTKTGAVENQGTVTGND